MVLDRVSVERRPADLVLSYGRQVHEPADRSAVRLVGWLRELRVPSEISRAAWRV